MSAFTLLQSHGSNPTPGKGSMWSFSASNSSRTGTPCRQWSDPETRSHASSHTRVNARKLSADGIGTIRSRPAKADRVLHAALLMAGIRVAEPGLEPVMRAEQGEQTTPGAMPVLSNTSSRPRHTHSAVSPGNAATQRMSEYGNDTARKRTTRSTPATTARAWPKSTCALPSTHFNSAKPSDRARCSCLQRLTQRRTDEYEPVNPHSATSRSYTRVAA